MVTFEELARVAPDIAGPVRARLEATGIGLVATVRRDGSPRISPFEVSIIGGSLYVGSMPGAVKARDLDRDPRAALLTPITDKDDLAGEGKLFLRARRLDDPDERAAVTSGLVEGTEMSSDDVGSSPFYELRITGAAWQHVDGDCWDTLSWTEAGGFRHRRREGPEGDPVEV